LNIQEEVLRLLDDVLSLKGRALQFDADTALLGNIPELDSMAVVSIIRQLRSASGSRFLTMKSTAQPLHRLAAWSSLLNGLPPVEFRHAASGTVSSECRWAFAVLPPLRT